MGKLLTSTFKSQCRKCGGPINTGEQFWWNGPKQPFHLSCKPTFDPTVPESAPTRSTPPERQADFTTDSTFVKRGNETIRTFPSFSSLISYAESAPCRVGVSRSSREPDWNGFYQNGFYQTESFEQAVSLARTGWQQQSSSISSISSDLVSSIRPNIDEAFHSFHDVAGCEVDIGRFVAGDPECMIELVPVKFSRAGRVIRIAINCGFGGEVAAESIIQRGIAVVALIDILSQLQHSTEVVLVTRGQYDRKVSTQIVELKAATDQLDIASLAFAIAHPSYHRRLMFSVRESDHSIDGGSVCSIPIEDDPPTHFDILLDQLLIGQSPKEWIIEHLTRFGLIGDSE